MIKPRGGEGSVLHPEPLFTPTCRHGTFEVFVKRGIWQRATRVLSFTTSPLWDDNARSRLHLPLGAQAADILQSPLHSLGRYSRGEVIQAFLFQRTDLKGGTQKKNCAQLTVFISVRCRKAFSAFLLKGLMESCVTFLLGPVLDCLCACEVPRGENRPAFSQTAEPFNDYLRLKWTIFPARHRYFRLVFVK